MASLAELTAARDRILKKLGVQTEQYGDRRISYHGPAESIQALRELDRQIEAAGSGGSYRNRQSRTRYNGKGL